MEELKESSRSSLWLPIWRGRLWAGILTGHTRVLVHDEVENPRLYRAAVFGHSFFVLHHSRCRSLQACPIIVVPSWGSTPLSRRLQQYQGWFTMIMVHLHFLWVSVGKYQPTDPFWGVISCMFIATNRCFDRQNWVAMAGQSHPCHHHVAGRWSLHGAHGFVRLGLPRTWLDVLVGPQTGLGCGPCL